MTSVLPTANPTTGKTHVAEVTKYHEGGTLKPYSHEEAVGPKGTSVDVSSSFRYCNVLYCLITSSLLFVFVSSVARRERERERETLINKSIINSVPQKINKATSKRRSMGGSMDMKEGSLIPKIRKKLSMAIWTMMMLLLMKILEIPI